jgi:hypothetical protein
VIKLSVFSEPKQQVAIWDEEQQQPDKKIWFFTNKPCWLEKFLKEPLQCTMRGSTRRYMSLEGNSKIYEKAHGK